ncbi:hypothetical protein ES288_A02G089700v1 [Gossypium darwinii]|uniref:Uncharacterized protein n=2 Tax=Gossypium TaxID=3633 RepID=A0A5D2RES5_GOSTO|nr:hypothetical protein ES288_A02G089700v1 [Gossypium darwinii]TYI39341.1 hypothetical protein ES332_A02G091900v1 [Gossypium tomentosum]
MSADGGPTHVNEVFNPLDIPSTTPAWRRERNGYMERT